MSQIYPQMISDLVFDLDDTLLNTSELIIPNMAKQVFITMTKLGMKMSEEDFIYQRHELAKSLSHKEIFQQLAEKNCASRQIAEKCTQAAIDVFYNPTLPKNLPLMDGAMAVLDAAKKKNIRMHLITSGVKSAQDRKIDLLKISQFFSSIQVTGFGTKTQALQKVLQQSFIPATQLLSIGNRLSHEIRDSKSIGAWTCYFAFGEHLGEVPVQPEDKPDFTINNWKEFPKACPFLNLPM